MEGIGLKEGRKRIANAWVMCIACHDLTRDKKEVGPKPSEESDFFLTPLHT